MESALDWNAISRLTPAARRKMHDAINGLEPRWGADPASALFREERLMIQPPNRRGGRERNARPEPDVAKIRLRPPTVGMPRTVATIVPFAWVHRRDFLQGRLTTWMFTRVLLPLAIVSLLLGAAFSFSHYPADKPFKKYLVSHMASREHNPEGYTYLAVGLLATGLLLTPFPAWLHRHVAVTGRRATAGWWFMALGAGGTTLVGFESALWPGVAGWHELAHSIYGVCGFGGIWLGSLCLSARPASNAPARRLSPLRIAFAVPMLCVIGSYLVVQAVPSLRLWSREAWPPQLVFLRTFAFWQWLMVAGVMMNFVLTVRRASLAARETGASREECLARPQAPVAMRRAA